MPTTTDSATKATGAYTGDTRSDHEVRADRWAAPRAGVATSIVAVLVVVGWLLRKTWRRLLPAYWACAELAVAAVAAKGTPTDDQLAAAGEGAVGSGEPPATVSCRVTNSTTSS